MLSPSDNPILSTPASPPTGIPTSFKKSLDYKRSLRGLQFSKILPSIFKILLQIIQWGIHQCIRKQAYTTWVQKGFQHAIKEKILPPLLPLSRREQWRQVRAWGGRKLLQLWARNIYGLTSFFPSLFYYSKLMWRKKTNKEHESP